MGSFDFDSCSLDAITIKYIPDSVLKLDLVSREEIEAVTNGNPWLNEVVNTPFGTLGHVIIPMTWKEFHTNQNRLVELIDKTIEFAISRKVKTIGLTGQLQNTSYIELFNDEIKKASEIDFSLGLDAVLAWQTLSLVHFVTEYDVEVKDETLYFFGIDPAYAVILKLLFDEFQNPKEIKLIHDNISEMIQLKNFIEENTNFNGKVSLIYKENGNLLAQYNEARFIIACGANAIDINDVVSGTKVLSLGKIFPYDEQLAIKRIQEKKDILTLSGVSMMSSSNDTHVEFDVPVGMGRFYQAIEQASYQLNSPDRAKEKITINGCQLSSLLCAVFDECKPTTSMPSIENSRNYLRRMIEADYFINNTFNCRDYFLSHEEIEHFSSYFRQR